MKYLLLAIVCFMPFFCPAQNKKFSFKMGQEYELPKKTLDIAFLGSKENGIVNLSFSQKNKELTITSFHPNTLKLTGEKIIGMPSITKDFNHEIVVEMQDKYYWLHSDWDKKEGKETLYYDKLDVKGAKILEANHTLLEATKIEGSLARTGIYSFKVVHKYKIALDANKKLLLIAYQLKPADADLKKSYARYGVYVFDDNMNKIWSNEFTLPYTDALMESNGFSIDELGSAYMVAKLYDNDKKNPIDKATGKPAYHFEVLKFSKDSKEALHTPVSGGDYFIDVPFLEENPLHEMVFAAGYSKKPGKWSTPTDGIFVAIINNGKVSKFNDGFYEFPADEMKKYESERTRMKMEKKDDYANPEISVRNVLMDRDGSVFLACEQNSSDVVEGTSSYSSYINNSYDHIYTVKINGHTGKVEWFRKIPKSQTAVNVITGLGFKLIADTTGYYFLFLDNKKNLNLKENEVPAYHKVGFGGQLVVVKLDKMGTMSKEILFDTKDEEVTINPTDFDQINNNQFIGRASLKKTLFRPLLITVN